MRARAQQRSAGTESQLRDLVGPVFDRAWYTIALEAEGRASIQPGEDAFAHWIDEGRYLGLAPTPLVHTAWLMAQTGAAPAEAMEAYFALADRIPPHPVFALAPWFQRTDPAPLPWTAGSNPLVSYARKAADAPAELCPFFDETWYLAHHPDAADALFDGSVASGLMHYLRLGAARGARPNPLFREAWVRHTYGADAPVWARSHGAAFAHYVSIGAERGMDPGPLFSERTYLAETGGAADDVTAGRVLNGLHHFILAGYPTSSRPNRLFRNAQYLRLNPDARPGPWGAARCHPVLHYTDAPEPATRRVREWFDEAWYVGAYPDVAAAIRSGAYRTGFEHFLAVGESLGRDPNAVFSIAIYRRTYPDIDQVWHTSPGFSPSDHFYRVGRKEGRQCNPVHTVDILAAIGPQEEPPPVEDLPDDLLATLEAMRIDSPLDAVDYFGTLVDAGYARFLGHWIAARHVAGDLRARPNAPFPPGVSAAVASLLPAIRDGAAVPSAPKRQRPQRIEVTLDWGRVEVNGDVRAVTLVVSGVCRSRLHPVAAVSMRARTSKGVVSAPLHLMHLPPQEAILPLQICTTLYGDHVSFNGMLTLPRDSLSDLDTLKIEIDTQLDQGDGVAPKSVLSSTTVPVPKPVERPSAPFDAEVVSQATIAICMAVFNPEPSALRTQLQSIVDQSRRDWICILADESTDPAHHSVLREFAADRRFIHVPHRRRGGFQYNFEIALQMVPDHVTAVGFADQDDIWYPNKLARLMEALDQDRTLVYCDMDLLQADGTVLPGTLLGKRTRNHDRVDDLFFANTVTGAACLFRRSLLSAILPLPPVPHLYHDQWVALIAAAMGSIGFVDERLYGYVQHDTNVLGASRTALVPQIDGLLLWRGVLGTDTADADTHSAIRVHLVERYRTDLSRMQLLYRALVARLEDAGLWGDAILPAAEVFYGALDTTVQPDPRRRVGADLRIALTQSALDHCGTGDDGRNVLFRRQLSLAEAHQTRLRINDVFGAYGQAGFLTDKTRPLRTRPRADDAPWVLVLIPELRASTFFGGYMGKFQVIRRLTELGHRVRVVTVDEAVVPMAEVQLVVDAFPEFGPVFERIALTAGRDAAGVPVGPGDRVIATTWWTAHMAKALLPKVEADRFVYLIQEYEPFTFVMGSWAAMADATYTFPHTAIFSSDQLCAFFRARGLGVFADGDGETRHVVMNNAIWRFPEPTPDQESPDLDRLRRPAGAEAKTTGRGGLRRQRPSDSVPVAGDDVTTETRRRRFVFYFRPEPHAARNMHEVSLVALARAIHGGAFGPDWDLFAMGSGADSFQIAGREVRSLGKLSITEYRAILPGFDLAMSLMYTPHPSLVPLELAAAGVPTITTSCDVKTEAVLRGLSPLLIPVAPDVESVTQALLRAVETPLPEAGQRNRVTWPQSWDDVFSQQFCDRLQVWLT